MDHSRGANGDNEGWAALLMRRMSKCAARINVPSPLVGEGCSDGRHKLA
jgi:hypothetical protein